MGTDLSEIDLSKAWQFCADAEPLIRQWDDDELCVVYQPLSGDTHLLDLLSVEVLRLVKLQDRTVGDLLTDICPDLTDEPMVEASQQLVATLDKLQRMGFVDTKPQVL